MSADQKNDQNVQADLENQVANLARNADAQSHSSQDAQSHHSRDAQSQNSQNSRKVEVIGKGRDASHSSDGQSDGSKSSGSAPGDDAQAEDVKSKADSGSGGLMMIIIIGLLLLLGGTFVCRYCWVSREAYPMPGCTEDPLHTKPATWTWKEKAKCALWITGGFKCSQCEQMAAADALRALRAQQTDPDAPEAAKLEGDDVPLPTPQLADTQLSTPSRRQSSATADEARTAAANTEAEAGKVNTPPAKDVFDDKSGPEPSTATAETDQDAAANVGKLPKQHEMEKKGEGSTGGDPDEAMEVSPTLEQLNELRDRVKAEITRIAASFPAKTELSEGEKHDLLEKIQLWRADVVKLESAIQTVQDGQTLVFDMNAIQNHLLHGVVQMEFKKFDKTAPQGSALPDLP